MKRMQPHAIYIHIAVGQDVVSDFIQFSFNSTVTYKPKRNMRKIQYSSTANERTKAIEMLVQHTYYTTITNHMKSIICTSYTLLIHLIGNL